MIMENSHLSFVQWDSFMGESLSGLDIYFLSVEISGSWFYESLNGMKAYFKSAACVHPPFPGILHSIEKALLNSSHEHER